MSNIMSIQWLFNTIIINNFQHFFGSFWIIMNKNIKQALSRFWNEYVVVFKFITILQIISLSRSRSLYSSQIQGIALNFCDNIINIIWDLNFSHRTLCFSINNHIKLIVWSYNRNTHNFSFLFYHNTSWISSSQNFFNFINNIIKLLFWWFISTS